MNNLGILLKNNFNTMVGSLLGKKKKRKSGSSAIYIAILAFFGFLALASLQAYSQFMGLAPLGLAKLPLFNGFLMTFVLLVLYVSMKVTAKPKTNDTDLLLSLPIKKSTIALSKVLSRYMFDLLISFLFLTPYIVLYLIYTGFSVSFLMFGLLFVFMLPLLSVGINYILEFIITRIFNKSKFGSILKTAFAFLVFLGSMALFIVTMPNYGLTDPTQIDAFIYKFPPISWFLKFLFTYDLLTLFYILLLTILPFTLGVILYTHNFGKTFGSYQTTKKELVFRNNTSLLKSLITKELKRYFLTPIYVLNTIIGPVFMIAFTVFLTIKGANGLTELLEMPVPTELVFAIVTLILSGFISLTIISASAISLEGKNLWILKSTPIKEEHIFTSKLFPNLILTAPFAFVCSAILSYVFSFSLMQSMLAVSLPLAISVIISVAGLLINLYLPKLEWEEEVQVVKQGLSVMVTMLLGFVLVAFPIILYYVTKLENLILLGTTTLAVYLLVLVVSLILLFTKGKQLFKRLH